jgi:predicted transposase YbfD/YdcC
LLDGLDLAGVVVTADALHTHPAAAESLVAGNQAHYLFCVKADQPTLLARCVRLPWHNVPVLDRTHDRGHGRVGRRTRKATVNHFGFPHAAQLILCHPQDPWPPRQPPAVADRDRLCDHQLTFAQASPARLADYLRGHWAIENGLYHVRDTAFAETP